MNATDQENDPVQSLLPEAQEITNGDRNASYGSPIENFRNIASMWTILLAHRLKEHEVITPREVADLNIAQKLSRNIASPKRDTYLDIAGYAKCGEACRLDEPRISQDGADSVQRYHSNSPQDLNRGLVFRTPAGTLATLINYDSLNATWEVFYSTGNSAHLPIPSILRLRSVS